MNWEDEIKQIEEESRAGFLAQDLERLAGRAGRKINFDIVA